MPKAETTFQPIGNSEKKMHGNPAVIISGFSAEQQNFLHTKFSDWGLAGLPLVIVAPETLPMTLAQASTLPDLTNLNQTPELPCAVIMSGLQEKQLNSLMRGYREAELPRPLWASVTPTSESWTIKYLLVELIKEREAMREAMLKEQQAKTESTPDL